MTLAIGTALQKGNYVIDALGSEDSIGPVYLATHVPSGQWAMVRVLGSRHPEVMPTPEQRAAFYQYLVEISDLRHGLLPERLRGFEDGGVCYQALSMPKGESLATVISPQRLLSLDRSLAIIRSLGDGLQALRPYGWQGLHITPDQVWQMPDGQPLTFTGFNLPTTTELDHPNLDTTVVQALTHLLYFLLTGQRADATQSSLGIDQYHLAQRHHHPDVAAQLDEALQRGNAALSSPIALADWLALLPGRATTTSSFAAPAVAPSQSAMDSSGSVSQATPLSSGQPTHHPQPTVVVSPAPPRESTRVITQLPANETRPQPSRKSARLAPWALLSTGFAAGLSGLVFGLYVRLQPAPVDASSNAPNATRFNPNQSFPPLPDWQGQDFAPNDSNRPRRERQPDYGDSPRQTAPVQRSQPAVAPVIRETPPTVPTPTPQQVEPINREPINPEPDLSEPPIPSPAAPVAPPDPSPAVPEPPREPASAPAPVIPAPPLEVAPPVAPAPPPPLAPSPSAEPPAPLTSS